MYAPNDNEWDPSFSVFQVKKIAKWLALDPEARRGPVLRFSNYFREKFIQKFGGIIGVFGTIHC
jgi:hypothetical protein